MFGNFLEVNMEKKCIQNMTIGIRDDKIIKVVKANHHQGDIRYDAFRGIQGSCLYFIPVSWKLFKCPDL